MKETRAWSPHSSCWDCSWNFRAFRVSVNLLRNPETQSLKLDVYSAESDAEEPFCAILKTRETDCKIYVPYWVMLTIVLLTPIGTICPQCLFMLVLCSDRQFPKGILNYSLKLSKSLYNYQETAQYITLSWRCFLPQPSLLRQKTSGLPIPFEGMHD